MEDKMFKKSIFLLTLVYLIGSDYLSAYDYLRVQDPQQTWRYGYGTIEEAVLSVRPRGLYMEFGLYLTFSAKGLGFSNLDTLEVQFYFELPEGAIVHDSWLWIGSEIIRGKIMDKWTAESIYEEIVSRRRDPSILFKRGQRQYELRIFPMAGNESRKVKITYLVPTQWNAHHVIAPLPTNLLKASKYMVSTFYLLSLTDQEWANPQIFEFPEIQFIDFYDQTIGDYLRADVPQEAISDQLHIAFKSPLKNGIYLSKLEDGTNSYYQLAYLPSDALDILSSYKVTILIDYDASKSNIPETTVLNSIKSLLHTTFASTDFFNLIFSQLIIKRASEMWIPADSIEIENTFSNLGENPISSYSNLPSLLANGIDFIKKNGNDGSILLISNSDQVGDYQVANQLIEDLLELMDPPIPIHVADFQNQNYSYHWIGGRTYYGNEYFYTNITRLTTANYYNIRSGYNFSDLLTSAFQSLGGFISSFDLHTKLQSGFCYGRFNLNPDNQSTYINRPIRQIGKYSGNFPFIVEASGVYKSEVFSESAEILESDIIETDSLTEEIWVGNYIHFLESQTQTNDVVSEIIDYSINERVLSIYSAFICLEPQRGGEVCYDCLDETNLVNLNETIQVSAADSVFQVYPNPFNSQTKINIKLSKLSHYNKSSFKIYNSLGQLVRTFEPKLSQDQKNLQFIWDSTNNNGEVVASGNYFFIVSTPEKCYSLKLTLLK